MWVSNYTLVTIYIVEVCTQEVEEEPEFRVKEPSQACSVYRRTETGTSTISPKFDIRGRWCSLEVLITYCMCYLSVMPRYISKWIILQLLFKFSVGCWLLHPWSPLDPRCHLLCIGLCVTKIRWLKGVLGLTVDILKIRLNYTIFSFWRTNFTIWCICLAHVQWPVTKLKFWNCGAFICSTLQHKCLAKMTMGFTCKLIETALGVTTKKWRVGAENAIFNEFKRNWLLSNYH